MDRPNDENKALFQSLHILRSRWKDGTFGEILDDWRWIFGYSKRYKAAIVFYTLLGVFSTTFGLVASVASKYLIENIRLDVVVDIDADPGGDPADQAGKNQTEDRAAQHDRDHGAELALDYKEGGTQPREVAARLKPYHP